MKVTYLLIGINIILSIYAWSNPAVFSKWTMNPYLIRTKNQYYRFITSGFIHGSYMHLFFNMLTLYFFGERIEHNFTFIFEKMAPIMYLALYMLAIIISDLPTFFKRRNDSYYNSVGASGAISAVVFASILFMPLNKLCLYAIICIPGFIFGILYLIYSYYEARRDSNINHDAHLYGALFGIIFCIIVYPHSIFIFIEQIRAWRVF